MFDFGRCRCYFFFVLYDFDWGSHDFKLVFFLFEAGELLKEYSEQIDFGLSFYDFSLEVL